MFFRHSEADIDRYCALGVTMFVVGSEMSLFVQAADGLADRLKKKYRSAHQEAAGTHE